MQDSLVKMQNAAAQQSEQLMALFQFGLNTTQEAIDLNTRVARQLLAISARHAPAMIEQPTTLPSSDLAGELAQAWNDYLQASQAMARELQAQSRQWMEAQGDQLGQVIADNLKEFKLPTSAKQDPLDIALRSWSAVAQNSFAQAAKWQENIEQAQQSSSKALAALTGKASAPAKRRASAVAA